MTVSLPTTNITDPTSDTLRHSFSEQLTCRPRGGDTVRAGCSICRTRQQQQQQRWRRPKQQQKIRMRASRAGPPLLHAIVAVKKTSRGPNNDDFAMANTDNISRMSDRRSKRRSVAYWPNANERTDSLR